MNPNEEFMRRMINEALKNQLIGEEHHKYVPDGPVTDANLGERVILLTSFQAGITVQKTWIDTLSTILNTAHEGLAEMQSAADILERKINAFTSKGQ